MKVWLKKHRLSLWFWGIALVVIMTDEWVFRLLGILTMLGIDQWEKEE